MIIVGAGIIGLSCAWRLAQRGYSVTIFDAREAAAEASWAGAGMLAPGGEVEEDSALSRMALASLSQYPAFIHELEEASGIKIDYQLCGAVEIALTPAEAQTLECRAARLAIIGIPSEPVAYKGSVGARFFPGDQLVAPRDVTRALRIACGRLGVLLHEREPVTQVTQDGVGVVTDHSEYRDREGVLIAAGAWSSRLAPDLPLTMPIKGHLIAYRPDRTLIRSILRHDGTYLLQRSDGLLVAGSSTEHVGFDRAIDEAVVNDIHSRVTRLLPDLAGFAPVQCWNGFRPGAATGMPSIGRIPGTSTWTAYGHYRNGILLAPETARLIAESVG